MMRTLLLMGAMLSLTACDLSSNMCMAPGELGTLVKVVRPNAAAPCDLNHGFRMCVDIEENVVVTVMIGKEKRICTGPWYPELGNVEIGDTVNISRLVKNRL
jgi:hypothetical protein